MEGRRMKPRVVLWPWQAYTPCVHFAHVCVCAHCWYQDQLQTQWHHFLHSQNPLGSPPTFTCTWLHHYPNKRQTPLTSFSPPSSSSPPPLPSSPTINLCHVELLWPGVVCPDTSRDSNTPGTYGQATWILRIQTQVLKFGSKCRPLVYLFVINLFILGRISVWSPEWIWTCNRPSLASPVLRLRMYIFSQ